MEKPTVHFNATGESGNIFFIMAMVEAAMNDPEEFAALWKRVRQGTYRDALQAIREKVDLIDDDGVY